MEFAGGLQGLEGRELRVVDLLTEHGKIMQKIPWRMGIPMISDVDYVERREDMRALEMLKEDHVILIMGGFRSGKTSLAARVAEKLKKELIESGKNVVNISQTPWKKADLEQHLERKGYSEEEILILQPYEVTWDSGVETEAVGRLKELKDSGNYLVLECNGDVRESDNDEEKEKMKQLIRGLAGDSIVTIGLATEKQALEAIRSGVDPVFSPQVEEWLVKEAGGNLLWAKILAHFIYRSIKKTYLPANSEKQREKGLYKWFSGLRKTGDKQITAKWDDIIEGAKKDLFLNAGSLANNVVGIMRRGIDPLQWTCPEGVDIEYYRQTIPNGSKLFNEWISKSMPGLIQAAQE